MRVPLFSVLGRRLHREERGFTLLEAVFAMGVIMLSLMVLAGTALVGFRGAAAARDRQAATGLADRLIEEVRALPFSTVSEGMKDDDLTGDTNVFPCGTPTVYKLGSCSGETIVHSSGASTAPLYPHRGSVGTSSGYTTTYSWSVYITNASGKVGVFRVTVNVDWTAAGASHTVKAQTFLSHPEGAGDASTQTAGGNTANFYGTAAVSPGNVVITPNGTVASSGVGVAGVPSTQWTTSDNAAQSMYALTAELGQGQITKANGQSTLTSVQKSGGTAQGGATTFSIADDDATTALINPTSAPTSINQMGPSLTLSGGGNSLTMNQYTETTTSVTQPSNQRGNVTKRSSAWGNSTNGNVSVAKPAGLALNDFMLAQVTYQGTCMSTPAGWTLVRCDPFTSGANKITSSIFYRSATASDVSGNGFSFSTGVNGGTVGGIIAYIGVDPTEPAPIDASGSASGTSTTASTGTISVSIQNARLVGFFAARGYTTVTPQAPGGGASTDWASAGGSIGGQNTGLNAPKAVGAAGASGDKQPPGGGAVGNAWTASLSPSSASPTPPMWVGQMIAIKPGFLPETITTTTTGDPGTESGSTVSTTQAGALTPCGSPTQTDGKACAYAAQSYAVPAGTDGAFMATAVNLAGSGLGKCNLYKFSPPSTNPTNSAYGRRAVTSGDGKIVEDVTRYYGTHTFGGLCGSTGLAPPNWPGYFVKYDAGTSSANASAQAGISATSPSYTTAGTITVWNGSGTTSFAVPTTGVWSTAPATVAFTNSSGYRYDISATLASGVSSTSATGTSEAKAVLGAPMIGKITYKLTNPSSQVLIDLTITVDLGTLTSYAKYTPAA